MKDRLSEPEIEALPRLNSGQASHLEDADYAKELEHDDINDVCKGSAKRREDAPDEALEIYMDILNRYIPEELSIMRDHTIILERAGEYDDTIRICDMAIKAIQARLFNADTEPFEKRKVRLNANA